MKSNLAQEPSNNNSDFLVGDVVVYIDLSKPTNLMTVHHVQGEGLLLDGNRHFALAHLVRHASICEVHTGKRHITIFDELICDLSGIGGVA